MNAEQEELKRDFEWNVAGFMVERTPGLFRVKPPHHHYNFISDQS
jgi:hypothetical protein